MIYIGFIFTALLGFWLGLLIAGVRFARAMEAVWLDEEQDETIAMRRERWTK